MTGTEFRRLVRKLEKQSAANPGAYQLKVAILAAAGYLYILLGLAVVLLALGAAVAVTAYRPNLGAIKVVVVLGLVVYGVGRALWVRIPTPSGFELRPADAPELFRLVASLEKRLATPRVDSILVTPEFNAAIVQRPRLGLLGWHEQYLLIGMPLMQAITPGQWQAIIAHELGHLSGNHGRFGAWIYRVRASWANLHSEMERQGNKLGQLLFGKFFNWFAPYFNAYSFVLAREHEYSADAASAEIAGAEVSRDALLAVALGSRFMNEVFWPNLVSEAQHSPEPPLDPSVRFKNAVESAAGVADAGAWLEQEWMRPTGYADTHPSLADRIKALGWAPIEGQRQIPPVPHDTPPPSAAQAYLGDSYEAIRAEQDRIWAHENAVAWGDRHNILKAVSARLAELNATSEQVVTHAQRWERVNLLLELDQKETALAEAKLIVAELPGHVPARLLVGQMLLEMSDERGAEHLHVAMSASPDAILPATGALFNYYWSRGEEEKAEPYLIRFEKRSELMEAAQKERLEIKKDARFEPHDLGPEYLEQLRANLAAFDRLAEAYIAKRVVKVLPEDPAYVLAIRRKVKMVSYESPGEDAKLVDEIARRVPLPDGAIVFALNADRKKLRRRLRRCTGSKVFP